MVVFLLPLKQLFINLFTDSLPWILVHFNRLQIYNNIIIVYINSTLISKNCCRENTIFVGVTGIVTLVSKFTNIIHVFIRLYFWILDISLSLYDIILWIHHHKFSSLNNAQPNDMSAGHISKIIFDKTRKTEFSLCCTFWIYVFQLVLMNIGYTSILMIITFPQIGLDNILFFLLFLSQTRLFREGSF